MLNCLVRLINCDHMVIYKFSNFNADLKIILSNNFPKKIVRPVLHASTSICNFCAT